MAINFQHAEAIDNNVRLALETAMNTILDGVRQELEANGGTVLVDTVEGEGTAFSLTQKMSGQKIGTCKP